METRIIQGGVAKDLRGQIRFVNEFDMHSVRRFYLIKNSETKDARGWRAHRIEQRWFYVVTGKFQFGIVTIDDWTLPSRDLNIKYVKLDASENRILHVPPGHAVVFKSFDKLSELLVFSDFNLQHAALDDFTYDLEYFKNLDI